MIRNNNINDYEVRLEYGNVYVISDIHFPYQDNEAIEAFLRYVEMNGEPNIIVLNGDLLDFYKLSRFSKDPSGKNPAEEIEMLRDFLAELRKASPNSDIYYTIGNHETRLEKYVLDNAPAVACLMDNVFDIIKLDKYNIIGCGSVTINDVVFKHGSRLGSKSGLSAIKEMEAHYMSGATGHTHRLSRFSTRKSGKRFIWLETGCLCDLNPEYMLNADWEQGFASIVFSEYKMLHAQIHPIHKGVVMDK